MDADAAKQWSFDRHIPLNDEKCVHMSFGGDPANAFVVHVEKEQEDITRIYAKRDLGIWLSSNMSFSLHNEKSAQKTFAVLRMIRRTFSRVTRIDFQILYGAYWSFDRHIPLNDEKCVHMSFGGDPANAFVVHVEKEQEDITRIYAKRDLGIWLSSNMSFSLHNEKSAQKTFAVLRMIRRTFSRVTRIDFQILYGAYVRPLLECANQVVYSGRLKDNPH
ncbi:hypothetical protein CLF_105153 [Clonorchis sinensis]|uniref:Uncharacterized protein n=1 Tax=Clonorchis sinensis TaxID=79923 RepID=G7YD29_CLOSI|nr:hypothetical protein CLF_105153 [Clonorchis sinensis]